MAGTTGCDRGIAYSADRPRAARCRREQGCSERADARQEARTAGRQKSHPPSGNVAGTDLFSNSANASVSFPFIPVSPRSVSARGDALKQRHEKKHQTPHRGCHRGLRSVYPDNERHLYDHLPFYRTESGDTLAAAVRPDI